MFFHWQRESFELCWISHFLDCAGNLEGGFALYPPHDGSYERPCYSVVDKDSARSSINKRMNVVHRCIRTPNIVLRALRADVVEGSRAQDATVAWAP